MGRTRALFGLVKIVTAALGNNSCCTFLDLGKKKNKKKPNRRRPDICGVSSGGDGFFKKTAVVTLMKNISTVTKVFFNLLYIYNFFFPSVIWLELFLALGVFPVQTQTCLCAATPQTQDAVVLPFGHRLTLNLMFYFHQSFGRSVETTPLTAEGRRNSAFGTACTR